MKINVLRLFSINKVIFLLQARSPTEAFKTKSLAWR